MPNQYSSPIFISKLAVSLWNEAKMTNSAVSERLEQASARVLVCGSRSVRGCGLVSCRNCGWRLRKKRGGSTFKKYQALKSHAEPYFQWITVYAVSQLNEAMEPEEILEMCRAFRDELGELWKGMRVQQSIGMRCGISIDSSGFLHAHGIVAGVVPATPKRLSRALSDAALSIRVPYLRPLQFPKATSFYIHRFFEIPDDPSSANTDLIARLERTRWEYPRRLGNVVSLGGFRLRDGSPNVPRHPLAIR